LNMTIDIPLTQFSHGAGCGCKISPAVLDRILHSTHLPTPDPRLLVGNAERDDAAVFDLGNGSALISTTDFFMPIVDDAFDFGRIASANAISDVYAMGGKPVLAIAILGWPIDKIEPEVAGRVLEGARVVCSEAGIALAGGHSIDCPEPVFGLAVNGLVAHEHLKRNSTAVAGCRLYLTKPLGVGILSTAQKRGLLPAGDGRLALETMVRLNSVGERLGGLPSVAAMTDVTGFGLLGHLIEMCEASGTSGVIEFECVPTLPPVWGYLQRDCIPGGTARNWTSYGHKVGPLTEAQRLVLADPQTSGGLLIAVSPDGISEVESLLSSEGLWPSSIGRLEARGGAPLISVV